MPTAAEPIEERKKTMSKFIVYALIDPRNGAVRYIGKSSSGLRRPRQHIGDAHRRHDGRYDLRHCCNWIRHLQRLGLIYEIEVVEEIDGADRLNAREMWWIAFARAWGCRLTNCTDGGEGALGRVPTPATRAKLSKALRGHAVSEETRTRMSVAVRAANTRTETKTKHRTAVCAAWARESYRENRRAAFARYETKALRRAAIKAAMARPEVKAAQKRGMQAAFEHPEYRAKLSAKARAANARPEVKERVRSGARAGWIRRRANEVLSIQQGPM